MKNNQEDANEEPQIGTANNDDIPEAENGRADENGNPGLDDSCSEVKWNEMVERDKDMLDVGFSDEDEVKVVREHHELNVDVEFAKAEFQLAVGQKFTNVDTYREVLREWAVREGVELQFKNNEKSRVTAVCKRLCDWQIYTSPIQDSKTFHIKSIKGKHACGREYKNVHVNSRFLSRKIFKKVIDAPKIDAK